jgi:membrane protease YdiL (CAAX protease family)
MKHMKQEGIGQGTQGSGSLVKMIVAVALTFGIYYVVKPITPPLANLLGWDAQFVGLSLRSILAVLGIMVLGGKSWLLPSPSAWARAWRFFGYLIVVNIVFGVIAFFLTMGTLTPEQISAFTPNAALHNAVYLTALSILVGINEEALFRGLLFGGFLSAMGRSRRGILCAAIVSSLIFGFFHVMGDLDFSNGLGIAQAMMKTLETGAVGFVLCVPVLEKRNLTGAMQVHAFIDWVIIIASVMTGLPETIGTYVSADATASIAAIVLHSVLCIIYLPKCIKSVKCLLALDEPQMGPFAS